MLGYIWVSVRGCNQQRRSLLDLGGNFEGNG